MNKKLLLTYLMVSVMGFSSVFAQEKEEVKTQVEQCLCCNCPHTEEEVEEEATLSTQEEEDATVKVLSCDKCGGLTNEDDTQELALS